jgi:phosphomethylpyrimidine synthase
VGIDVRKGIAPLRCAWIMERNDTEELAGVSSAYGREREQDPGLAPVRFVRTRLPRRAKAGRA